MVQKFLKIQKSNTDEYFLQCKMIEIFCNLDLKAVKKLKLKDADKVVQIITDMFEQKPKLTKSFVMNNIEYGVIPNLDDISLGEYIDLDTYMGDWDNMEIAMNVLYRPIDLLQGQRYTLKEYDPDINEEAKNYPLDACFGAMVFFYDLGKDLSTVILNSSSKQNEESLVQFLASQPNGDGIIQSMQSLTEILQGLKISLN